MVGTPSSLKTSSYIKMAQEPGCRIHCPGFLTSRATMAAHRGAWRATRATRQAGVVGGRLVAGGLEAWLVLVVGWPHTAHAVTYIG
jgi:hypothetical protein